MKRMNVPKFKIDVKEKSELVGKKCRRFTDPEKEVLDQLIDPNPKY
jgi:hypothetical protein